uniref:Uncharacterized protein n=1 Tax=Glossina brevipalpis TaxID=37001 RepID=A0A1A9WMD0_9MUSC
MNVIMLLFKHYMKQVLPFIITLAEVFNGNIVVVVPLHEVKQSLNHNILICMHVHKTTRYHSDFFKKQHDVARLVPASYVITSITKVHNFEGMFEEVHNLIGVVALNPRAFLKRNRTKFYNKW